MEKLEKTMWFIGGMVIMIIIVLFLLKYVPGESKENNHCGEAVKYYFESEKPFLIMINGHPKMQNNGSSSIHFPICEEEKIYCYEEDYNEILNPDGTIKEGIEPYVTFIASYVNAQPFDCVGNNCIWEKVNSMEVCKA